MAYTTADKVQTQKTIKDQYENNSKASKTPVFTFTQDSKPFNKAKKDKKKKQHKDKRNSRDSKDFKNCRNSIILAIGVNTAEIRNKKKRKKDVSEITYYNHNKKRYYGTKCSKP